MREMRGPGGSGLGGGSVRNPRRLPSPGRYPPSCTVIRPDPARISPCLPYIPFMTADRERDWRASAGLSVARGLAASPRVVAPTPSARAFPASVCRAGPYFTAARVLKTAFKEMAPFRRLTGRLDCTAVSGGLKATTGKRLRAMATRNAIARLRREAGLSQYRLAVMVGVTEKTVWNWERRGIADAKYGAAKRLARALGVPMEDLEEEE